MKSLNFDNINLRGYANACGIFNGCLVRFKRTFKNGVAIQFLHDLFVLKSY